MPSLAYARFVLIIALALLAGAVARPVEAARPGPPATILGTPDNGSAVKPSDVILRIQRALAAVGLYEGRTDGRMNPETETAIRKFQQMIGIPETGQASEALADRLDTGDRVNELLGKLEKAREDNIRAARAALLANPATRDLIVDELAERSDPTRDIASCLEKPTPRCLLNEAVESSKGVADKEMRDWSLGEILAVQARGGFAEGARDTARRIRDPRLIMVALRDIAEAQAQGGFGPEATAAAEAIPDPKKRAEAFAAITEIFVRTEKLAEARDAARRLETEARSLEAPMNKVNLLVRAAVARARAGERAAADPLIAEAETIARAFSDASAGNGLRYVANGLADLGRTNEALRLLKDIPEKTEHIPVLVAAIVQEARSGNVATAHALASTIGETHHRAGSLASVALAQNRAGDRQAAVATLAVAVAETDRITFPFAKSFALSRLALAYGEVADAEKNAAIWSATLAGAIALAEQIADDSLRAQALWVFSASADRRGDTAQANTISKRADRATRDIKSRLDQSWMLSEIALARARRGETDAALATFRRGLDIAASIDNAWGRARAFARLTAILMQIER